jgi:AcrR family transcriptional regulator
MRDHERCNRDENGVALPEGAFIPAARPPAASRRERKKNATHAAIVRAAFDLFVERGYSETSIAEIAESADVSESTFYAHFAVKEELVVTAIDSKAEILESMLAERDDRPTTVEVLNEYLGGVVGRLSEIQATRQMLHGAISAEPELLERLIGRWSVRARPALLASFARDFRESEDGLRTQVMTAVAMGLSNHVAYTLYAEGGEEARVAACVRLILDTLERQYAEIEAVRW